MSNSAVPSIPSELPPPHAMQPLVHEADGTIPIIVAATDHGTICLLNFDLDHRWAPRGTDHDGYPFWLG